MSSRWHFSVEQSRFLKNVSSSRDSSSCIWSSWPWLIFKRCPFCQTNQIHKCKFLVVSTSKFLWTIFFFANDQKWEQTQKFAMNNKKNCFLLFLSRFTTFTLAIVKKMVANLVLRFVEFQTISLILKIISVS